MGAPVTLFGETEWARYRRLRDLGVEAGAEGVKGQRNVYQMKLRDMEAAVAAEDPYGKGRQADERHESETALKEDADAEAKTSSTDEDFVYSEIQRLLRLWDKEMNDRPIEVQKSQKGKAAKANLEQTKEYLKPLVKLLKARTLDPSILRALKNIFEFVLRREYVQASDVYLQLAIGNAPWPMGATMVGIHARSAREKIGEGKIAHVMNDEQTRKYIQAVKV